MYGVYAMLLVSDDRDRDAESTETDREERYEILSLYVSGTIAIVLRPDFLEITHVLSPERSGLAV